MTRKENNEDIWSNEENSVEKSDKKEPLVDTKKTQYPPVDPKIIDFVQSMPGEDLLFNYLGNGNSNSPAQAQVSVVDNWIENNRDGKTIIKPHQARAMSILPYLPKIFPEIVDELEQFPFLEILEDYKLLVTAIEGKGRKDQKDVILGMFGNRVNKGEEEIGGVKQYFVDKDHSDNKIEH